VVFKFGQAKKRWFREALVVPKGEKDSRVMVRYRCDVREEGVYCD